MKEIFKCEDLSKKMQLLEKFFGVALWIDHRMLIEAGDNSFRYQRDLHFVQEYMNEMKRYNLIKNQTKVKMLMEFEGAIIQNLGHSKYLIGTPPYNHHNDTYQEECLYTHRPDGRIEPLFEAKWMKYEKYEIGQIYAVENFTALFNTHFSLLNDQGHLLVKEPLGRISYAAAA